MNETTPIPGKAQHAWCEVSRSAPPKRAAAERVADFLEVYGSYDEATAREQASRCLLCPEPSCVAGCPLASRIPEWLLLTAEGQFMEAAALTRSTSNLPEICARVCPTDRLCEGACILNGKSEPISISAIERFLNEYAFAYGTADVSAAPPNGFRVAILGSGPGGLSCADELAKRGYEVTVFESQAIPGGLLVNGIPAFKLERSVVARRIAMLRKRGINFELNTTVGEDVRLAELRAHFDAIFLAFGAPQSRLLTVPGAEREGVHCALPFIIQHATEVPLETPPIVVAGRRVVVLGGGDTAMDCLRTAMRSGARETTCVYRRDQANLPGSRREFENSVEEGARFIWLATPAEVLGDAAGKVSGIRCLRTQLGGPDLTGRRKPSPMPGTEFDVPADVILVAFGFEPKPFPLGSDLSQIAINDQGMVIVDPRQMTNLPGVFAGGDLVRGPSLVVHAVRDARKAALEIHRYLYSRKVRELFQDATDHLTPETL